jgi:hypothetical protein
MVQVSFKNYLYVYKQNPPPQKKICVCVEILPTWQKHDISLLSRYSYVCFYNIKHFSYVES